MGGRHDRRGRRVIWLDYFLQAFVEALAWSLAVITALGLVGWGVWTLVKTAMERPE